MLGLKFRRQHPLSIYFADFACVEIGLVVELDGGQHAEGKEQARDAARERCMSQMGFTTLRFWNNQALAEITGVLERIREVALSLTPRPHPSPLPREGEGEGAAAAGVPPKPRLSR